MSENELEALLAKQAITEVLYRYCRGLDRMDKALALSVWHPGSTADYGPIFTGSGAEFVEWVWVAHEALAAHSHQITNIMIDVTGDHATSEAYVTVALRTRPEEGSIVDIVDRGRYLDRWSRRRGLWAIDSRRFVEDFQAIYPVPLNEATDGSQATGRRGPNDPSYDVLG
jgi:SnoaL-like domain